LLLLLVLVVMVMVLCGCQAGHALLAWLLPNAPPPVKVTILGKGRVGGYTQAAEREVS
jgi:ATP-dependent Zn protease